MSSPTCRKCNPPSTTSQILQPNTMKAKQSGQGQYVKQRDSDTAVYQPLDEALLTTMINSASQKQLAHLLQNLCSRSKTAAKLAQSQLLALQKEQEQEAPNSVPPLRSILKKTSALDRNSRSGLSTTTEPSESLFAPVSAIEHATFASEPGPNKRKAMSHCRNCGREYTLAASAEDSCTHHPGKIAWPILFYKEAIH